MKTVVMGKITRTSWWCDTNRKDSEELAYTAKPELKKKVEVVSWQPICEYDGKPQSCVKECNYFVNTGIYISGDEFIPIENNIFRADLSEWHQRVDKVLKNDDFNKDTSEKIYESNIRKYNRWFIENDERLSSYCRVHKLNPAETNPQELLLLLPRKTDNFIIGTDINSSVVSVADYYGGKISTSTK